MSIENDSSPPADAEQPKAIHGFTMYSRNGVRVDFSLWRNRETGEQSEYYMTNYGDTGRGARVPRFFVREELGQGHEGVGLDALHEIISSSLEVPEGWVEQDPIWFQIILPRCNLETPRDYLAWEQRQRGRADPLAGVYSVYDELFNPPPPRSLGDYDY